MGIKQEINTNRLQDLQTFLVSCLFKNLVASCQRAISLSLSCIIRSLLLYYCRSLRMLVYAKGRRIITPPHVCTHENTITYKCSFFKLPKKGAQDNVFENFANRAGVTQRVCGCVGIFFYDSWLSGRGRRLFHNTSLEKKLCNGVKKEKWI